MNKNPLCLAGSASPPGGREDPNLPEGRLTYPERSEGRG